MHNYGVASGGKSTVSISKLSITRLGSGGVRIPVMSDKKLKTFLQKPVRFLQIQNICMRCPVSPHPLQQRGEEDGGNLEVGMGGG